MGKPMASTIDKDEINKFWEAINIEPNIAIAPEKSGICCLKMDKDSHILNFKKGEQTLECEDESGNRLLFYKLPDNTPLTDCIIEVDGVQVEVIFNTPVTITPYFKWGDSLTNGKIQLVPDEISKLIFLYNEKEVSSQDVVTSPCTELAVSKKKRGFDLIGEPLIKTSSFGSNRELKNKSSSRKFQVFFAVRRPETGEPTRVRDGGEWSITVPLFLSKGINNYWLVSEDVYEQRFKECRMMKLNIAINDRNTVFIWPIKDHLKAGNLDSWNTSAHNIAEIAKDEWVKVSSNEGGEIYEPEPTDIELDEPQWPSHTLEKIINMAFKGKYIDSTDHHLFK